MFHARCSHGLLLGHSKSMTKLLDLKCVVNPVLILENAIYRILLLTLDQGDLK